MPVQSFLQGLMKRWLNLCPIILLSILFTCLRDQPEASQVGYGWWWIWWLDPESAFRCHRYFLHGDNNSLHSLSTTFHKITIIAIALGHCWRMSLFTLLLFVVTQFHLNHRDQHILWIFQSIKSLTTVYVNKGGVQMTSHLPPPISRFQEPTGDWSE